MGENAHKGLFFPSVLEFVSHSAGGFRLLVSGKSGLAWKSKSGICQKVQHSVLAWYTENIYCTFMTNEVQSHGKVRIKEIRVHCSYLRHTAINAWPEYQRAKPQLWLMLILTNKLQVIRAHKMHCWHIHHIGLA